MLNQNKRQSEPVHSQLAEALARLAMNQRAEQAAALNAALAENPALAQQLQKLQQAQAQQAQLGQQAERSLPVQPVIETPIKPPPYRYLDPRLFDPRPFAEVPAPLTPPPLFSTPNPPTNEDPAPDGEDPSEYPWLKKQPPKWIDLNDYPLRQAAIQQSPMFSPELQQHGQIDPAILKAILK